jgi:hypothetical protein
MRDIAAQHSGIGGVNDTVAVYVAVDGGGNKRSHQHYRTARHGEHGGIGIVAACD